MCVMYSQDPTIVPIRIITVSTVSVATVSSTIDLAALSLIHCPCRSPPFSLPPSFLTLSLFDCISNALVSSSVVVDAACDPFGR